MKKRHHVKLLPVTAANQKERAHHLGSDLTTPSKKTEQNKPPPPPQQQKPQQWVLPTFPVSFDRLLSISREKQKTCSNVDIWTLIFFWPHSVYQISYKIWVVLFFSKSHTFWMPHVRHIDKGHSSGSVKGANILMTTNISLLNIKAALFHVLRVNYSCHQ